MAPLSWKRPNQAEEFLPEDPMWNFAPSTYPSADYKKMGPASYISMFACDQWFLDQERHLTRWESASIMKLIFFGDNYKSKNRVFENFEDPAYPQTAACRRIHEPLKMACTSKVQQWLAELRRLPTRGREAREIEEILKEFTGRLPIVPFTETKRPIVNERTIRDDQLFLFYALMHLCRDSRRNKLNPLVAKKAYFTYFKIESSGGNVPIFKTLADPTQRITMDMARLMADPKLEKFFGDKAHKMHLIVDPAAILVLSSDDVPSVTHTMESLSLKKTAPASPSTPQPRVQFPYSGMPQRKVKDIQDIQDAQDAQDAKEAKEVEDAKEAKEARDE